MSTGTCVSFETKRRHSAQFTYTNCQFFLRPTANFFVLARARRRRKLSVPAANLNSTS